MGDLRQLDCQLLRARTIGDPQPGFARTAQTDKLSFRWPETAQAPMASQGLSV